MDAIILCGGKGVRMSEKTETVPKALIEIGGNSLIYYIMKLYFFYGIQDFILCLGYKGKMIRQYFKDIIWVNTDCTFHINDNNLKIEYHSRFNGNFNITFIDTGENTLTATRLKRVEKYIKNEEFLMTYCDGLSDVNINNLIEYHKTKNKLITITGVNAVTNYGIIETKDGIANGFIEKPKTSNIINGGFMVLNKEIFKYIPDKEYMFEDKPLKTLVDMGEVAVYEHKGFWLSVDTMKDIEKANYICSSGKIPWKVWN